MTADTQKDRLRAILRQALDDTLAAEVRAGNPGANGQRLSGPWGMFFDEHSAWDSATCLNRGLYLDLKDHFDDNMTREILLAAADVKISRTSLTDARLPLLRAAAERHGFQILPSEDRWILQPDRGKGGWANRVDRLAQPQEEGAIRNVYMASDTTLAETGKMLDEAGEDDLFGALLGIPACCREAFGRFRSLAAEKQCDFVPYVSQNTSGAMPYDWRLNYIAQYFGRSLLSFFPCSFRCPAAAAVAESTLRMLAGCDAAWASGFVALQRTNILYTENEGLHLIRARLCNGVIAYGPEDLRSTAATGLARLLRQGDRLEIIGKNAVRIYRGSTMIADVAGEDTCLCAFH